MAATVAASSTIDGGRIVVTPGLINTHHHITGEPITRGFVPDDVNFPAHMDDWLCELHSVQTPEDEQLAATIASVGMLRTGTTTVLEAGTIHYLEPVVERASRWWPALPWCASPGGRFANRLERSAHEIQPVNQGAQRT